MPIFYFTFTTLIRKGASNHYADMRSGGGNKVKKCALQNRLQHATVKKIKRNNNKNCYEQV